MSLQICLLGLMASLVLALATSLDRWRTLQAPGQPGEEGVMARVFGSSRKLFSAHFFLQADVYYHLGYYPGIFDGRPLAVSKLASGGKEGKSPSDHPAPASVVASPTSGEKGKPGSHNHEDHEGHDEEVCFHVQQPLDRLERFGRNFRPSAHLHADEKGEGGQREILPWLELAASLDPQRVETYVVASYWLRKTLSRPAEAERFLRQGLRQNPGDPDLLYELARVYLDHAGSEDHARNVLEMARAKWLARESARPEVSPLVINQILGQLILLERKAGHLEQEIVYLRELKRYSPAPMAIETQISEAQKALCERERRK